MRETNSSRLPILVCLILCLSVIIIIRATGKEQSFDGDNSLEPYTKCNFEDGLKVIETTRLSKKNRNSRTVTTHEGEKRVSVLDGYRVMVAYPHTHFFANIKAEKSNPDDYAKDKEVVIESLRDLAGKTQSDGSKLLELRKVSINGYEGVGTDRTTIDHEGVQGVYALFLDTEHEILTIYFLRQEPNKTKFKTIDEYYVLRDKFFETYTNCVKKNRSSH